MSENYTNYKTAESVSPGHPDKICDQISDAILDAYIKGDELSRVAIEAVGGHGKAFIVGEVKSNAKINIEPIVKSIAGDIEIETRIVEQSSEISQGVDGGGAGDQGIMVGYACNETEELLPKETVLARKLNEFLYQRWPFDGKTQITLKDGRVNSIVASFQNSISEELKLAIKDWLAIQKDINVDESIGLHVNPAGEWTLGGFDADTGLTGRKLVVDNYGPRIPIGGGCFSGKDPSKVDRSAAYAARQIAIDYLHKYGASEVYCYLAYAIGYNQPLESVVIIDGKQEKISGYDLSPNGIIDWLSLRSPIYLATSRYGHFGHKEFNWEKRTKQ